MLADLDLAGGTREAGHRPGAGRGHCCQDRPPGWGLPARERERGGGEMRKQTNHQVLLLLELFCFNLIT